jgi:hypothetical protein
LLMTCFMALQDITEDMGGTVMLPRTAHALAHKELSRVCEASLGRMREPYTVRPTAPPR